MIDFKQWPRAAAVMLFAVMLFLYGPAADASNYVWNSTGTDWGTSGNWNLSGFPGLNSSDTALFDPEGATIGSTVVNPVVTNSTTYTFNSLTISSNQNMTGLGWTFGGSGTLSIGGAGSTGLTTYGFGEYTFGIDMGASSTGPTLQGSSGNPLQITVTTGSQLILSGKTTTANLAPALLINGGTVVLDNSVTTTVHLVTTTNITIHTGTLQLDSSTFSGNSTFAFGNLGSDPSTSGFNQILVLPNGVPVTTTFARLGPGGASGALPSTFMVFDFMSSGTLGGTGATDPKILFTTPPPLATGNNLIAGASNQWGFAIVTDSTGTNFATYATNGITAAIYTQSGSTAAAANFTTSTSADRTLYTPGTSDSLTTSAAVVTGVLKIAPTGAGASLTLSGGNDFSMAAIMLDGTYDFTIEGSANLGSTGGSTARYVYVNNYDTTLHIAIPFATTTGAYNFIGPGFTDVSGSSSTGLAGLTNGINIMGNSGFFSTLRASAAQLTANSGLKTAIGLYGGVLEIADGSNGAGASADLTLPVQSSLGSPGIYWTKSGSGGGSGGFSAFGANASVSLGGATPTALQWNSGVFVGDGYALMFGSVLSNAVLTFYNPIQLDNGTGYQLRQIEVTLGVGGDSTRLAGQITGASNADLMKTGSGYLNLTANNTYAGNTLIQGGTLLANNGVSSTGAGNVFVYSGASLGGAGVIAPAVGHTVTVANGASISPGSILQTVGSTTLTTGTLTIQANTILQNGSTYFWKINNASPSSAAANSGLSNSVGLQDFLAVTGGSNALVAGNITFWIFELQTTSLNPSKTYSWQVASSAGTPSLGTVTFYMNQYENEDFINYVDAGGSMVLVNNSGYFYLNLTPAPEPTAPLLIAAGAMAIFFVWRKRRFIVSHY